MKRLCERLSMFGSAEAHGIEVRTAPERQDLTRIGEPISRISQICSEGIETSDYRVQILSISLMPLMRLTPPFWMGALRTRKAPSSPTWHPEPRVVRMSGMSGMLRISLFLCNRLGKLLHPEAGSFRDHGSLRDASLPTTGG